MESDVQNADSRLYVEFYNNPIQNEFKTTVEGRPIFEDMVFVKIQVPGDNTFNVNTPARDDHKQRFPMHWQRFQNAHGDDMQLIGTPLSHWPLLTPSAVEELKYQKFMTVEQIAGASDAQLNKLGMRAGTSAFSLRERANNFLDAAKGESEINKRADEIKQLKDDQAVKDAKHAQELAELKAQMTALMAAMEPTKIDKKAA